MLVFFIVENMGGEISKLFYDRYDLFLVHIFWCTRNCGQSFSSYIYLLLLSALGLNDGLHARSKSTVYDLFIDNPSCIRSLWLLAFAAIWVRISSFSFACADRELCHILASGVIDYHVVDPTSYTLHFVSTCLPLYSCHISVLFALLSMHRALAIHGYHTMYDFAEDENRVEVFNTSQLPLIL